MHGESEYDKDRSSRRLAAMGQTVGSYLVWKAVSSPPADFFLSMIGNSGDVQV